MYTNKPHLRIFAPILNDVYHGISIEYSHNQENERQPNYPHLD